MVKKELKKHVSAIRISNNVGLLGRKIWNVFLLNAYDDLLSDEDHAIPISVLADVIGYNSKSYTSLEVALDKLQTTLVKWDIGGGAEVKGAWVRNRCSSQMLGAYEIHDGILHYSFPKGFSQLLYNPALYQKINISQQKLFKTSSGMALWENCLRYINVGSTGFSDIDEWRSLLGATAKSYSQYFRFNGLILKPAITEVNKVSNIEVTLKTKKKGRKVVEIGFTVKLKEEKELLSGSRLQELESSSEYQDLITCGIHKVKALKWLDDYGFAYIREKLDFVKLQGQSGNIKKSLSGLLVKAVTENYQSDDMVRIRLEQERKQKEELARKEAEYQKKLQEKREELERQFTKVEIDRYLSGVTDEEKADLLAQAKKENPMLSSLMTSLDSPMCLPFLLPRIPDYEKNKEEYIKENLKT